MNHCYRTCIRNILSVICLSSIVIQSLNAIVIESLVGVGLTEGLPAVIALAGVANAGRRLISRPVPTLDMLDIQSIASTPATISTAGVLTAPEQIALAAQDETMLGRQATMLGSLAREQLLDPSLHSQSVQYAEIHEQNSQIGQILWDRVLRETEHKRASARNELPGYPHRICAPQSAQRAYLGQSSERPYPPLIAPPGALRPLGLAARIIGTSEIALEVLTAIDQGIPIYAWCAESPAIVLASDVPDIVGVSIPCLHSHSQSNSEAVRTIAEHLTAAVGQGYHFSDVELDQLYEEVYPWHWIQTEALEKRRAEIRDQILIEAGQEAPPQSEVELNALETQADEPPESVRIIETDSESHGPILTNVPAERQHNARCHKTAFRHQAEQSESAITVQFVVTNSCNHATQQAQQVTPITSIDGELTAAALRDRAVRQFRASQQQRHAIIQANADAHTQQTIAYIHSDSTRKRQQFRQHHAPSLSTYNGSCTSEHNTISEAAQAYGLEPIFCDGYSVKNPADTRRTVEIVLEEIVRNFANCNHPYPSERIRARILLGEYSKWIPKLCDNRIKQSALRALERYSDQGRLIDISYDERIAEQIRMFLEVCPLPGWGSSDNYARLYEMVHNEGLDSGNVFTLMNVRHTRMSRPEKWLSYYRYGVKKRWIPRRCPDTREQILNSPYNRRLYKVACLAEQGDFAAAHRLASDSFMRGVIAECRELMCNRCGILKQYEHSLIWRRLSAGQKERVSNDPVAQSRINAQLIAEAEASQAVAEQEIPSEPVAIQLPDNVQLASSGDQQSGNEPAPDTLPPAPAPPDPDPDKDKQKQSSNVTSQEKTEYTSVEELIKAAGKLERKKQGARQGSVKGNAENIFYSLAKQYGRTVVVLDEIRRRFTVGSMHVTLYNSSTNLSTININLAGKIFKIRISG